MDLHKRTYIRVGTDQEMRRYRSENAGKRGHRSEKVLVQIGERKVLWVRIRERMGADQRT